MPPSKYNGAPPPWPALRFLLVMLIGLPACAWGQRVLGPWEDATTAPRGTLRAGIATKWINARERYGRSDGRVEALGTDFILDSLGRGVIPDLATLEDPLRSVTGLMAPALSLGSLDVQLETSTYVTPITLEFGLTDFISIGAVIPYVKNRVEVLARPNAGGASGTLGLNPAFSGDVARGRNDAVVLEINQAAAALQAELTRCLNSTDPTCMAVNADRQAAVNLVTTAGTVAAALADVYGTTAVSGSRYAPVANGVLQAAVESRLSSLSSQFTTFLGTPMTGDWIAARPVPAAPLALTDFDRLIGDPDFAIGARPFADVERSHVGDIEVGAKFLLLDTFGQRIGAPPTRRAGARFAVAGLVRLPTAQVDSPDDFIDIGTGDGQMDIEMRGHLDLLSRLVWTTVTARYGLQLSDTRVRRVTDRGVNAFPALSRRQEVEWDPGDVVELELTPRYVPNDAVSLSLSYRFRSKGADSYSAAGAADPLIDPAALGIGTAQREHRVGAAFTYSTVRGYHDRQSRWPMEISLLYLRTISGQGVPVENATGVAVRIYRRIVGRNAMRP